MADLITRLRNALADAVELAESEHIPLSVGAWKKIIKDTDAYLNRHTHLFGGSGSSSHTHPHDGPHIHTTELKHRVTAQYQRGDGELVYCPDAPEYVSRTKFAQDMKRKTGG